MTDGEVWNEGVSFYEAGDVTNALRVLRPLMLSKTHGPRAAEVVAKLEHERGNREEAAGAAQIALRANPKDERANRNFTRATDGLLQERANKRIETILKAAEGKDAGSILKGATEEARRLMVEAGTYRTNAAARAVSLADAYSKRAERLAESWIPVRQAIAQSVTNETQAATIIQQLDQAESATRKASQQLADLEGAAYGSMSAAEEDFTRFLKLVVLPPMAMAEDLVAQSNAWQDVEVVNGRAWQPEALDYTRSFRAKFPAWARAYEQQAQADTNCPPFTADDQAKVSALATELEKLQLECCEKNLPASQEQALGLIRQIQELLPKNQNGGGQGAEQNQQPQEQNQQPQEANQQPQESQSNEERQAENPEEQPEEQDAEESEKEDSREDEEVEALLKKAQERNDEHEADKKARMRKAPLAPNECDW